MRASCLAQTFPRCRPALGALVLAALVASGCDQDGPPEAALGCPEHAIAIDTGSGGLVTDIPVASGIDDVPEFHDCQRLIVDKAFGPLVAIWIAEAADTLFTQSAAGMKITPVPESAHVETTRLIPSPPVDPQAADLSGAGVAYAVVEIYNFDSVPYRPLAIQPGFSCLYLSRLGGQSDQWQAWMLPLGKNPTDCRDPKSAARLAPLGAVQLLVHATSFPTLHAADIPPVARWDREPDEDGNHYIGIKCGNQWCEVGSRAANGVGPGGVRDFRPSPDATGPVGTLVRPAIADLPSGVGLTPIESQKKDRVLRVKGWYDQQELARFVDNRLVLSGVTGTIIPHPALDTLDGKAPFVGAFEKKWIPAAYIHVTGDYDGKRLTLKQGLNTLSLCKGSASDCGVTPVPACPPGSSSGLDQWWMKLDLASGASPEYSCVWRDNTKTVIPAGAARWRWLETDETTWVRCEEGCCTK